MDTTHPFDTDTTDGPVLRASWEGDDMTVRISPCGTPLWSGGVPEDTAAFVEAVLEAADSRGYSADVVAEGVANLGDGKVYVVHPAILRGFPSPLRTADGVYRGAALCKVALALPDLFPGADPDVQRWALSRWFPDIVCEVAPTERAWTCVTSTPSTRWPRALEVVARPSRGGDERIDVLVPVDGPWEDGCPVVPDDVPPCPAIGTVVVTGGAVTVPMCDIETFHDAFEGDARALAINPYGSSRHGSDDLRVIDVDGRWAPRRARRLGDGSYELDLGSGWRPAPDVHDLADALRGRPVPRPDTG